MSCTPLANVDFFIYISIDDFIFSTKSRHMKKAAHPIHGGKMAVTLGLAVAFLSLVMILSYLFISGSMK